MSYEELDCPIFRFRSLKYVFYKNSFGKGEGEDYTPTKEDWKYPSPNSSWETLYKKVYEEHQ